MKVKKFIPSEEILLRWIKKTRYEFLSKSSYTRRNAFAIFRSKDSRNAMMPFYYFLFKEVIKTEEFSEEKFQEILEKELDEVFIEFIKIKFKKVFVDKNGKITNLSKKSFLKKINEKLFPGEKYWLSYQYLGPWKKGELVLIKKGQEILWDKKSKMQNHPNGKIIFPGDCVQLEIQFPN